MEAAIVSRPGLRSRGADLALRLDRVRWEPPAVIAMLLVTAALHLWSLTGPAGRSGGTL